MFLDGVRACALRPMMWTAEQCVRHPVRPPAVQVLPPGENKTQKVAVGDLSGVVQVFSVKRGEVVLSFKTLPSPLKVLQVFPAPSVVRAGLRVTD